MRTLLRTGDQPRDYYYNYAIIILFIVSWIGGHIVFIDFNAVSEHANDAFTACIAVPAT